MNAIIISLVIQLVLLLIVAFLLYERSRQSKQAKIQLQSIYEQIEKKSLQITGSINYAKRIQEAILPPQEEFQKFLPESFIFFKPKDVVSGDFYWVTKKDDLLIIVVADCVGHGIPGAFMSMIGNTLLNEIVNEKNIIQPDKVLKQMNQAIIKSLHQTNAQLQTQEDGMDIAICTIDMKSRTLNFSGANHSAYIINNNKLDVIKGELFAIGGITKNLKKEFLVHTLTLAPDTCIYLFSDGFPDQFGGPGVSRKKYMTYRFKELLLNVHHLPMLKQKQKLETELTEWQGKQPQTDDMVVVGMKV